MASVERDVRLQQLQAASLYFICGVKPGGKALREVAKAALAGGVESLQLREKNCSPDELERAAEILKDLAQQYGALFIVNDYPDLAARWNADGVHLGQADTAVEEVRRVVGKERLIGLSTHTPAQIDSISSVVDYIGVGPIYSTPTKAGRPAVGVELVRYAAKHAEVPFFAVGGIDLSTVATVVAAGARRIAVVRAIAEAVDPAAAASELRRLLSD